MKKNLRWIVSVVFWFMMVSVLLAEPFRSAWPKDLDRIWVGSEYWANRLQDWRIANGRLECVTSGHNRSVHLLTHRLGNSNGSFQMSVRLGCLAENPAMLGKGWVGFQIGAKTDTNDYRRNAIYGRGLNAGITTNGYLFIADTKDVQQQPISLEDIELRLKAEPKGFAYRISLSAHDPKTAKLLGNLTRENLSHSLIGNLALVCSRDRKDKADVRFWFRDWKVAGTKVYIDNNRTFGPVLFAQYTLSNGILKMTAQMPPIGQKDSQFVRLQIREKNSSGWSTISKAPIDKLARTATFRIEKWDASRDTPYRLAYALIEADGRPKDYYWYGTIRRDPVDKETIVVAAFTGNNDLGFPNTDIVKHVRIHNPDVLIFTGDQIYERVAGYGVQRSPLDKACLDYLRKWYLLGWSFGDLMRDRPTVCLPDDHDVYHGNLWGASGRKTKGQGRRGQDSGGYKMPAEWVKMVERTQTAHLPDPYDPTPVEQGIGVYYCAMNYGQVSFAIIEDRKFKSSPTVMLPEGKVVNGWFQNKEFDPVKQADAPGAKLLGQRQLAFLDDWAADWSNGTWMKVVLSQTIFSNVATLPKEVLSDAVVPKLRLVAPGEYPPDDMPVADADSGGWPQTGRNEALRQMRRAFAFHLAGDQHLGSVTQYGVDQWHDAGYAFCVPAIANVWPRRWLPMFPGRNRKPGAPRYTGDFKDGFGNFVTVYAVSNPVVTGREPSQLYDRATGYGIVKFNRNKRTITIECWPRYANPNLPQTGGQYPGWPITIKQTDNYGQKPSAFLPTITVTGMTDPVVQVIDRQNKEIVYTLRIKGKSFRPGVFKPGVYTVKVGQPGTEKMNVFKNVTASQNNGKLEVVF